MGTRQKSSRDSKFSTEESAAFSPPAKDEILTEKKSRKRKRGRNDRSHDERNTNQSKPLKGKIVAVSALLQDEKSASSCSFEDDREHILYSYKKVVQLCEDAGAKITGQVHKRVHCVVATKSAVKSQTQRVRKAWKKGIPVVGVSWIRNSVEKGRILPFSQYHLFRKQDVQSHEEQNESTTCKHKLSGSESKETMPDTTVEARTVDLGCCCVCHETDDAADCEWCVDCGG